MAITRRAQRFLDTVLMGRLVLAGFDVSGRVSTIQWPVLKSSRGEQF
jgi:hypothetical protein